MASGYRSISRRQAIQLFIATVSAPIFPALAVPTKPLETSLTSIVLLRDSLISLKETIENGTNSDVKRTVKTLLLGTNLPTNVKDATQWLPKRDREDVQMHGREAYEYLDQVVKYFDATQSKKRVGSSVTVFSLQAIQAAGGELDAVLAAFDGGVVDAARRRANGDY